MKKTNWNRVMFITLATIAPLVIIYSKIQNYDKPEFPTADSAKWSAEAFNTYEDTIREEVRESATPEDYANEEYNKIEAQLDSIYKRQDSIPEHAYEQYVLAGQEQILQTQKRELADSLLNAYVDNHPDVKHIKQVRADKAKYDYQMDSLSKIPYGTRFVSNLKKIKADMFSKTK